MRGSSAGSNRRLLAIAAVCFIAVVVALSVNERTSGRLSWHLPDGGRIHLSRVGGQYALTKVTSSGGMSTVQIDSADEITDAELHTDDAGDYWLVDRARRKVVGFFAAADGMHVGAMPDPTVPEAFGVDRGRVIERSMFFGVF